MLVAHILLVLLLVALVVAVTWWDRGGLKDNVDGHVSFADAIYFTSVWRHRAGL